ncbi:hypothetical protein KAR91_31305 [Candidatus Pacearchaeota archaeon]|nr:hypothetical protein [Candidatus Pacearchaeota archaeon]
MPKECIPPNSRGKELQELKKVCENCDDKETCPVDFNGKYWDCIMSFGLGDPLKGCCNIALEKGECLRAEDISLWTHHILWLRTMQLGLFVWKNNMLTFEEWEDLGKANETIRDIKQRIMMTSLFQKSTGL